MTGLSSAFGRGGLFGRRVSVNALAPAAAFNFNSLQFEVQQSVVSLCRQSHLRMTLQDYASAFM